MNSERTEKENWMRKLAAVIKSNPIMAAILILLVITYIVEPNLASIQNLKNIISQLGPLALMSLTTTLVLICGFRDLSAPGIINLSAYITMMLIEPCGQVLSIILGLGFGAVIGWINSKIILSSGATKPSETLFITYGLQAVYNSIALIIGGAINIQMADISRNTSIYKAIGVGRVGIFTVPSVIFLAAMVLLHIFYSRTYWGRTISLTGGNRIAATMAGVPTKKAITLVFTLSGVMCALVGIVLFSRIERVQYGIGTGYDFQSLLSVVIGGTSMRGGHGSIGGTFVGVLFITLLSNCLDLLGVNTYLKSAVTGVTLIIALWLDIRKQSGRSSK